MKTLHLLLLASLSPWLAAQELTWNELANRPEFWPSHVTVNRAFKFGNGQVPSGATVEVLQLRGQQLQVASADGLSFAVKPEETDALAQAQATWNKLTPAQRALTYRTILAKQELWPYRVNLTQLVRLNIGDLKPGTSVIFKGLEGGDLLVIDEKAKALFTVPPRGTDLLDRARAIAGDPKSHAGRITEDLRGKLIHPLTGAANPLADTEPSTYVFYRGASWCGPCRQFSPALVKFYREQKAKHPDVEFVYISGDKSPAEMRGYAKEAGFEWRTVASNRQPELQLVNPLFNQYIPQLVVTNRQGEVLVDSARSNTATALRQLDALLKRPKPAAPSGE